MKNIKKFNESGFLPHKDEKLPREPIQNPDEIMNDIRDAINEEVYDLNLKIGELDTTISRLKDRIDSLDYQVFESYEKIEEIYRLIDKLEEVVSDAYTHEDDIEEKLEDIIYDIKNHGENN